MITSPVGLKQINNSEDVAIIQKLLNFRKDLTKSLTDVKVDGVLGIKTLEHLRLVQKISQLKQDAIVSPFGVTLKVLWPLEFGKPTGYGIRGKDSYGEGHHGASRGSRVHDGADYVSVPGQKVKAPMSGVVTKISRPYRTGIDALILSGVEILASDGSKAWVWYIQPDPYVVGSVVKAGTSVLGIATTLTNRYKNGITDHVHLRIHDANGNKVNPATLIPS